jgi:hypothetical protein
MPPTPEDNVMRFPDITTQIETTYLKGASFSPDDRVRIDHFSYERALSPQWEALVAVLGKPLEHKQFVQALQLLRPSITDYPDIIRQFKKVSFTDRTNIVSEPTLTLGQNENLYKVDVNVSGGGATDSGQRSTSLPSEFEIVLQYARGSSMKYRMVVELDLTTISKGDRKELRFTLVAPDLPNVVEQAIEDEVIYFRQRTAGELPRLLTLVDY